MWLDRFSARETRSAAADAPSRSYSPGPRRPTHLAPGPLPPRPGLNPRASSLSLVSNASNSSSPAPSRLLNGSSLKTQITSSPPAEIPNPLDVLKTILGDSKEADAGPEKRTSNDHKTSKPLDIAREIDFGELSLQEFADSVSDHVHVPSTDVHSITFIAEYNKEGERFEDLHRSILACDEVLGSVERYLRDFQQDLGTVSAEIETLQSKSTGINLRIENRKTVEKLLGPVVEEITIPPAVVRRIADGAIDEEWLVALQELQRRAKVIEKSKAENQVKAADDVKPLVDGLINKAAERIRDYFVAQIKALRSPNVNTQPIQDNEFLRRKQAFVFLAEHQPQLADDISQAYINTMRWYYSQSFERYHASLSKMRLYNVDSHDVLGASLSGGGTSRSRTALGPSPHDPFSLGRRAEILKHGDFSALPAHIAEEDKGAHYLETPFRAFNLALLDNASFEYSFITSFFASIPRYTYHRMSTMFTTIFTPTFALGTNLTKTLIDASSDATGVLMCVRLTQTFAFELQRRKVPSMEAYINATTMLLWPRFQQIMDLHLASLHHATSALPSSATRGNAASAALSSLTSSSSAKDANQQSTAPHPLTQRFANFVSALLTLSSETGDDEPIANSAGRLRAEFEAFVTKASRGVGEQRRRNRFLANQWEFVGAVLEGVRGRLAEEMRERFRELRAEVGE